MFRTLVKFDTQSPNISPDTPTQNSNAQLFGVLGQCLAKIGVSEPTPGFRLSEVCVIKDILSPPTPCSFPFSGVWAAAVTLQCPSFMGLYAGLGMHLL